MLSTPGHCHPQDAEQFSSHIYCSFTPASGSKWWNWGHEQVHAFVNHLKEKVHKWFLFIICSSTTWPHGHILLQRMLSSRIYWWNIIGTVPGLGEERKEAINHYTCPYVKPVNGPLIGPVYRPGPSAICLFLEYGCECRAAFINSIFILKLCQYIFIYLFFFSSWTLKANVGRCGENYCKFNSKNKDRLRLSERKSLELSPVGGNCPQYNHCIHVFMLRAKWNVLSYLKFYDHVILLYSSCFLNIHYYTQVH